MDFTASSDTNAPISRKNLFKSDLEGFGTGFPYAYGSEKHPNYYKRLTLSPASDEVTFAFIKSLIVQEGLGQEQTTDYLAVSFSSFDQIVHKHGLWSLEAEDAIMRLDQILQRLLTFLDQRIGLGQVLLVLSADHGIPEAVPLVKAKGFKSAQYFDIDAWMTQIAPDLKRQFGLSKQILLAYEAPYLYLDQAAIKAQGVSIEKIRRFLASALKQAKGVAHAFAVQQRQVVFHNAPKPLQRQVLASHHEAMKGDIYLVLRPYVYPKYVHEYQHEHIAVTTHGSPWQYDTHVPLAFAGYHLKPRTVHRTCHPTR